MLLNSSEYVLENNILTLKKTFLKLQFDCYLKLLYTYCIIYYWSKKYIDLFCTLIV